MMKRLLTLLLALCFGILAGFGCVSSAPKESSQTRTELNFANAQRLRDHWLKHRGEFDTALTEQQYLEKARAFFESAVAEKELKERSNGDELHYIPGTNEFGVLTSEKVIRTYFRPSSGRAYWDRQ